MSGSPSYRKVLLRCSARQFGALIRTLQRDGGGLWPAAHPRLEVCAVSNERFDDPYIAAGWVVYEAQPRDAPLRLDLYYGAATIECYEVAGGACAVYFLDGQEPGGHRARAIGPEFAALADAILEQAVAAT